MDSTRFQFDEISDQVNDPLEYPRKSKHPGLIIIINYDEFKFEQSREGSIRDCNELIICFQRLGFTVEERFIFRNLMANDIKEKIHKISEEDELKDYNCLIVVYSSHGAEDNKICTYDEPIFTDDIINPFGNSKNLTGKPKLFIFQTCKGFNYTTKSSNVIVPVVPTDTYTKDFPDDLIIAYSTSEGNKSFRHTKYGSWFIQEICRNFTAFARRDDVANLMIRVTKCVASHYKHGNYRQNPIFISTLRKKFYITRSRNRNLMLDAIEKNKKCLEELEIMIEAASN